MLFDDFYYYFFWLLVFMFLFFYILRFKAKASFTDFLLSSNNLVSASSWEPEEFVSIKINDIEYSLSNAVTNNWESIGEVEYLENNIIKIGGGENLINQNILSQEIKTPKSNFYSLGFEYLIETEEVDLGFDEPAFEVFANNQLIFQEKAENSSNAWQVAVINLTSLNKNIINLSFEAGNTVDSEYSTAVYLRNIRTSIASVNSESKFVLSSLGNETRYEYFINNQRFSGADFNYQEFWLNGQPDDYLINIYKNNSLEQVLAVYFDNQKPELINNLEIIDENNNEFSLKFIAPSDNVFSRVNGYLVDQKFYFAEKKAGDLETLVVTGSRPTSIKAVDQAGNIN